MWPCLRQPPVMERCAQWEIQRARADTVTVTIRPGDSAGIRVGVQSSERICARGSIDHVETITDTTGAAPSSPLANGSFGHTSLDNEASADLAASMDVLERLLAGCGLDAFDGNAPVTSPDVDQSQRYVVATDSRSSGCADRFSQNLSPGLSASVTTCAREEEDRCELRWSGSRLHLESDRSEVSGSRDLAAILDSVAGRAETSLATCRTYEREVRHSSYDTGAHAYDTEADACNEVRDVLRDLASGLSPTDWRDDGADHGDQADSQHGLGASWHSPVLSSGFELGTLVDSRLEPSSVNSCEGERLNEPDFDACGSHTAGYDVDDWHSDIGAGCIGENELQYALESHACTQVFEHHDSAYDEVEDSPWLSHADWDSDSCGDSD